VIAVRRWRAALAASPGGLRAVRPPARRECPPEPPALAGSESRLACGDERMLRQFPAGVLP